MDFFDSMPIPLFGSDWTLSAPELSLMQETDNKIREMFAASDTTGGMALLQETDNKIRE